MSLFTNFVVCVTLYVFIYQSESNKLKSIFKWFFNLLLSVHPVHVYYHNLLSYISRNNNNNSTFPQLNSCQRLLEFMPNVISLWHRSCHPGAKGYVLVSEVVSSCQSWLFMTKVTNNEFWRSFPWNWLDNVSKISNPFYVLLVSL